MTTSTESARVTVQLRASWIAGAALTVLSSAAVAALTMTSATVATPAPRIVAAFESAPAPVTLSFPAPPAPVVTETTAPVVLEAAPAKPAPARATSRARRTDPRCEGADWQQRRGQAAVERLRRPADARAIPVAFRPARSDVLGMADLVAGRVDVYVRTCGKQSDALLLHVVAHELGHVLDGARLTDELRAQWSAARGIPASTPWYGCNECTDFATPAGDFAETYAQWQRGGTDSRSQLAPAASRTELERLAARFFPAL